MCNANFLTVKKFNEKAKTSYNVGYLYTIYSHTLYVFKTPSIPLCDRTIIRKKPIKRTQVRLHGALCDIFLHFHKQGHCGLFSLNSTYTTCVLVH